MSKKKQLPLDKAVKELNKYNKEHGTNLSWGKYSALRELKKGGDKKCREQVT